MSISPTTLGAAYRNMIGLYHAAKAKNSAQFQEKFYQLPKEFKERIKTLNLEFDSNDTDARLSYSLTVIEMIAKEEFHLLSPELKTKVTHFNYLTASRSIRAKVQDIPFKTDQEREVEIAKIAKASNEDEIPILLSNLAFVIRNPDFALKRR